MIHRWAKDKRGVQGQGHDFKTKQVFKTCHLLCTVSLSKVNVIRA